MLQLILTPYGLAAIEAYSGNEGLKRRACGFRFFSNHRQARVRRSDVTAKYPLSLEPYL